MLLADDLIEGLRPVAAVERGLTGHRIESRRVGRHRGRGFGASSAFCETEPVSGEDLLDHGRRIAELERQVAELYKRLGQAQPTGFGGDEDSGWGFSEPASVSADADPRLIELIDAGKTIHAIKLYRELTGTGLREAKDAVERLAEQRGAT